MTTDSNSTTEDLNAKWEREARELAVSLIAPVASAIEMELSGVMKIAPDERAASLLLAAKCALTAVLTGLLPRFREEAVVSSGVDEWAYRTSMNYLNLLETMAGVEMTRDV